MPEAPSYNFDTPLGKVKIQCKKDDNFFYCNVASPIYRNDIKLEKAKLIDQVSKFIEWLK